MKQYGYLEALVMSFYSRDLYRDVAKNWGGNAILYLFLLLAVLCIPYTLAVQHSVDTNFSDNAKNTLAVFVSQVPVINLNKDGTISTPENKPYIVYDPVHKTEVIAVIDTSGHYTTIQNQKYDLLITKNTMFDRKGDGTIEVRKIPTGTSYVLHPDKVSKKIEGWAKDLWIIAFPLILIGAFIGRLIQALFLALVGKVMSLMMDADVTYSTIYILTLVALTPAIVIKTIITCTAYYSSMPLFVYPHLTLIYFLITIVYLFFAINANKLKAS